MDISHVVKKIRNNILKSGKVSHCKRHLMIDDKYIEWEHFKRAYLWDIASHPFPVHHKLTQEHIFLTPEAKMRIGLGSLQKLIRTLVHLSDSIVALRKTPPLPRFF
jgi:hypothetical protein